MAPPKDAIIVQDNKDMLVVRYRMGGYRESFTQADVLIGAVSFPGVQDNVRAS